jgi:hypothetical protein
VARRVVTDGDTTYTVSPLEAPPAGDRDVALLTTTVSDENTGLAPRELVSATLLSPLTANLIARMVDAGQLVVSGRARPAFTPSIATTGEIDVRVAARSFITRKIAVTFPCSQRSLTAASAATVLTLNSIAGLQLGQRLLVSTVDGERVEFAAIQALGPGPKLTLASALASPYPIGSLVQPLPPDLAVELHRAPITIAGRVLTPTGATTAPLANATVRVSQLWRKIPPPASSVPPDPPDPTVPPPLPPWAPPVAAVWPPCYADLETTATVVVEDRPVDGTMPAKTLLDDTGVGDTIVRCSDALAVAVNDVIAIDADDTGRTEIVEVAAIKLSLTTTDWAWLTLHVPLALPHRRGRVVRRLGPPGAGAAKHLNYAAYAGDAALLFDTTGLSATHQVKVTEPGPPVLRCYHQLSVLETTSGVDGTYRLPPISRAGRVQIAAKDSGSAKHQELFFDPDYELDDNRLDLVVR